MPSIELDETDFRILSSLQEDSRTPLKELARSANASIPTIRARIKRLTDLGIIKQFTVAIDQKKLTGGVISLITIKAKPPQLNTIAQIIKDMEEVSEVYLTTGEHDLIVKVSVPDIRSLEDFILHKLSQVPGIEASHNSLIIEVVKEKFGPTLRPGFGIKLFCTYCKKEIKGDIVKRNIQGHDYFFCCETCASVFEKERIKR
ncbi:MAG: Lrp/AsnC ligand binding domain-containing protein [archaeon]|nr:Lrp/AsnC ligand binding domain-containing protein [archaeon]MCP8314713.1 Lrp/AsnC ligand binding domain-containing protein [archaeon]MCP8315595.1 Lrp/AsnC ligand binding domain-containing protein [archaeon]MCP8319646.1 Lrp/AsnC ligand binding domain-containing protein [archaeon]